MRVSKAFLIVGLLALMPRPGVAQDCDRPLTDVIREVSPAVVFISALTVDPFKLRDRVAQSIGSGVIIDADGLALTNAHVVHGAKEVSVVLDDGDILRAQVLGTDPILDLAVIGMPRQETSFPVASIADSSTLQVGEGVLAIGNPFGLGQTVTHGIVSGLNRVLPQSTMSWLLPLIQTDAAINPGNSGGPLVNRCGAVVGINTATMAKAENVGFAVPINIAMGVLPQLIEHGRVIRPWHGVYGQMVHPALFILLPFPLVPGFLVETIEPGSPAEKIGLKGGELPVSIAGQEFLLGGDVITKINDEALTDLKTVGRAVRSLKVGDTVRLEYFRGGEIHHAEAVLPERPILPGDFPK